MNERDKMVNYNNRLEEYKTPGPKERIQEIKKESLKSLLFDFFKDHDLPDIHIILIAGAIGTRKTTVAATILPGALKEFWGEKIELIENDLKITETIEHSKKRIFYIPLDDHVYPFDDAVSLSPKTTRASISMSRVERDYKLNVLGHALRERKKNIFAELEDLKRKNCLIYVGIVLQGFRSVFDFELIKEKIKLIILKSYIHQCEGIVQAPELVEYLQDLQELTIRNRFNEAQNQGVLIEVKKINVGDGHLKKANIKKRTAFQIRDEQNGRRKRNS